MREDAERQWINCHWETLSLEGGDVVQGAVCHLFGVSTLFQTKRTPRGAGDDLIPQCDTCGWAFKSEQSVIMIVRPRSHDRTARRWISADPDLKLPLQPDSQQPPSSAWDRLSYVQGWKLSPSSLGQIETQDRWRNTRFALFDCWGYLSVYWLHQCPAKDCTQPQYGRNCKPFKTDAAGSVGLFHTAFPINIPFMKPLIRSGAFVAAYK